MSDIWGLHGSGQFFLSSFWSIKGLLWCIWSWLGATHVFKNWSRGLQIWSQQISDGRIQVNYFSEKWSIKVLFEVIVTNCGFDPVCQNIAEPPFCIIVAYHILTRRIIAICVNWCFITIIWYYYFLTKNDVVIKK